MDKLPPIVEVLARLQERLGADAFQIMDHSEGADLASTGVAHPADPQWLVYIITWQKPAGCYAIELEQLLEHATVLTQASISNLTNKLWRSTANRCKTVQTVQ